MTKEYRVRVCMKTAAIIDELEKQENGLPSHRLIQIAIDNELDQEKPFNYPISFPDEDHYEDKYAHEAGLIFKFMQSYSRHGASLMMLLLLRRKVGIDSRERLYGGYKELLDAGMIEEYYPKRWHFVLPKWYRIAKIKSRVTE